MDLLASRVVVTEEAPTVQTIQGVPTSVAALVGIARKGPIGVATVVTSYAEFKRIFGGETGAGYAALAVQGFFQNGGQRLYFVRTVHYSSIGNANSKTSAAATLNLPTAALGPSAGFALGTNVGPFNLTPADTLVVTPNGGSPSTATFNAARATQTAANSEPYALADNDTLLVRIDGGSVQTITFLTGEFADIANATAAEVIAVINAKLAGGFADLNSGDPRINSDVQGTSSHVEITGGTANTALGFPTSVANGSGNVADINAVTVAEIKTIVEAAVSGVTVTNQAGAVRVASNTTGPSSSVLVGASSTADDELGFDNATHSGSAGAAVDTLQIDAKYDGEYGNDITVLIANAPSGDAEEFTLTVLDGGIIVETFPNLSMDDAADRYVESVINDALTGSNYIVVTDLDVNPASAASERPANASYGPLTGGDDGLASLGDNDFIGDDGAKNGMRALDLVNDAALLLIPDRATAAVHQAGLSYCEVTRGMSMFYVMDPPAGLTCSGMVSYADTTAGLIELSDFGALYYPRVKVLNPNKAVFGSADSIVVPPSGHVAGVMARLGSQVGGVYQPPGGLLNGRILGIVGLETNEVLEQARRDLLYPKRINPLTKLRGQPFTIDGARTLKASSPFPSVSERRGMIFIEQSIKDALEIARLRNNDEALRDEVNRTITAFLTNQMRAGAFRTRDPNTAFRVDTSEAINPPSAVFAGQLNVRVGVCTNKVAEYIIIAFSQDTRALETELAAAG